jgi:hypothetical protein
MVVCLLGAAIGHAVLCRLAIRLDFVLKAVVVGGFFGGVLVGWSWWEQGGALQSWAALLAYGFLFELYIFFFTLVSTSVSVSLLLKLAKSGLREEQIEEIYSSRGMVEVRFEKLLRAGLLRRDAGRYGLSMKAWMVVLGFRALRFFFRHPHPLQGSKKVPTGAGVGLEDDSARRVR